MGARALTSLVVHDAPSLKTTNKNKSNEKPHCLSARGVRGSSCSYSPPPFPSTPLHYTPLHSPRTQTGVSKEVWDEMMAIRTLGFNYHSKPDPIDFVSDIVSDMHLVRKKKICSTKPSPVQLPREVGEKRARDKRHPPARPSRSRATL